MRQRECEFVRQRRCDPANTVRKLAEIACSELAIFQEVEQKRIHFRAHRLHRVECERIAVALIRMENAKRWIKPCASSARRASDSKHARR